MKDLIEIQSKIKSLENATKRLTSSLGVLLGDIQTLQNRGDEIFDYETIRLLSHKIEFKSHPISRIKNEHTRKTYIELLLTLLQADTDNIEEKIIFVQWILNKAKLEDDIEQLHHAAVLAGSSIYDDAGNEFSDDAKRYLVTDMIIIAGLNGEASDSALEYIADICALFEMSIEDAQLCSLIAKTVLLQGASKLNKADRALIIPYMNKFSHYLSNEIRESVVSRNRTITVKISDKLIASFNWSRQNGSYVSKGELIAKYRAMGWRFDEFQEVKAKATGCLFYFKHNHYYYGVISYESDNKDNIKEWVKENDL